MCRQRPLQLCGPFQISAHPEVAVVRHRQDNLGVNFCDLTRLTFLGSVKKRVPLRAAFSRRNIQAAQDVDRIRKPVVSTAYELQGDQCDFVPLRCCGRVPNPMRNGTRSSHRPPRPSGKRARSNIMTLFDDMLSLGESYEELLRLRERVAALSRRKRKKTKPSARKCRPPGRTGSPGRRRR